jgi:tRNA threonylcarbamoyladenosine biosynthesis protein TsaE
MKSANSSTKNTQQEFSVEIFSETDTQNFAAKLAPLLKPPLWVELEGALGAGKTTLTRYVLRKLGHQGSVKSPTYTLVEPYQVNAINFYHFDLYRLGEPEELDYLGIRDYLDSDTIAFVEWPSKGIGFLPNADCRISISMELNKRVFKITALSELGQEIVTELGNCSWDNQ